MTNLQKILIGAGIVGVGVIATPIIYNNQINKFIKQEKTNLQAQNIEIKETKNNDSFFTTNREYIVTVKDISPIIQELYPQIDFYSLRDLKEAFDNTKFLVKLNILKFPVYHKDAIKIDLYSFNKEITKELLEDKTGKQLLDAIKNRAFEAILDINNLKISKAKLKDIDLTLDNSSKYKIEKFNLKIQDSILNIENNNLKISKIATIYTKKSEYRNETINFNINKIETKTKHQNLLNNSSTLKIASISYNEKSKYNNTTLKIDNITNSSSTKTITNKTSINNKLDIKNISLTNDKNYVKINGIKYNFNISNLYAPALKNIIDMINKNNLNNKQKLTQNLNTLIQKGFKVSVSPLSINTIKTKIDNKEFNLTPIKINFDATLLPNKFMLPIDNPSYLSNKINAKLKAETSKENIDLLNNINPQAGMMINLISKEVNNKILINLEYQNGMITSNGKPLIK